MQGGHAGQVSGHLSYPTLILYTTLPPLSSVPWPEFLFLHGLAALGSCPGLPFVIQSPFPLFTSEPLVHILIST